MSAIRLMMGILAGALSVVVLTPGTSYACSCVQRSTAQFVDGADVVVSGVLTDIDEEFALTSTGTTTYTVEVDRVLKGVATRKVRFESQTSGAACGLEVAGTGRSYVFFLNETSDGYSAGLCGGTAEAQYLSVGEVGAITGPATEPSPGVSGSEPVASLGFLAAPFAVAAGVVLLLPVGLLWLRMRTT